MVSAKFNLNYQSVLKPSAFLKKTYVLYNVQVEKYVKRLFFEKR